MKNKTAEEIFIKNHRPIDSYEAKVFDIQLKQLINEIQYPNESLEKMLDENYPVNSFEEWRKWQSMLDNDSLNIRYKYYVDEIERQRKIAAEFYQAGKSQSLSEQEQKNIKIFDALKWAIFELEYLNSKVGNIQSIEEQLPLAKEALHLINLTPSEQADKKWINVTEKLPKFNEEVLVLYRPITPNMGGELNKGIYKRVSPEHISMLPSSSQKKLNEYSGFLVNVVFWMPLPEIPKQ